MAKRAVLKTGEVVVSSRTANSPSAPSTIPNVPLGTSTHLLRVKDAELVFGLVGAAGTNLEPVEDVLQKSLGDVGYKTSVVRLSRLLHAFDQFKHLPAISDEFDRYQKHMDAGDDFREKTRRLDAMASLAISEIQAIRESANGDKSKPLSRRAYILHSLKRPEEVEALRLVYGDSFHLIVVYSARDLRIRALSRKLYKKGGNKYETPRAAESDAVFLINRDEEDRKKPHGQNVRDAFALGDVFVNADKTTMRSSMQRFIALLFGHPFITPNRNEFCMFHAQGAAARSAEPGRQVGAAISTEDGQILALGTNDVAKPGGGLYWYGDKNDAREFKYGQEIDSNSLLLRRILLDLIGRLKSAKWFSDNKDKVELSALFDEALPLVKGAKLMNIIEFMRAVHAEMCAIVDASRRGINISGATMYVTTFPCHECAKHIVAAGIKKCYFIEPYAKSQTSELFSDSISVETKTDREKILFEPFVGIAPRRYMDFFLVSQNSRKKKDGTLVSWDDVKKNAQPKIAGAWPAYTANERIVVDDLGSQAGAAGFNVG